MNTIQPGLHLGICIIIAGRVGIFLLRTKLTSDRDVVACRHDMLLLDVRRCMLTCMQQTREAYPQPHAIFGLRSSPFAFARTYGVRLRIALELFAKYVRAHLRALPPLNFRSPRRDAVFPSI